jgi:hypothetical protein
MQMLDFTAQKIQARPTPSNAGTKHLDAFLVRKEILADYHLRVGQIIEDARLPEGRELIEQRLDETEVRDRTTVSLITARRCHYLDFRVMLS